MLGKFMCTNLNIEQFSSWELLKLGVMETALFIGTAQAWGHGKWKVFFNENLLHVFLTCLDGKETVN